MSLLKWVNRFIKGQILVHLNNQDNASRLAQAQANLASTQAQANQARLDDANVNNVY